MQSAQRDAEEPGNQPRPATMQSAQRDAEEPGNQPRPATMQSAQRDEEWAGTSQPITQIRLNIGRRNPLADYDVAMRSLMSGSQTSVADSAAPRVASVAVEFPPHHHGQHETITALVGFAGEEFRRFAESSGVEARHHALPLHRYAELSGFTEANDAFTDVAVELGERALRSALDSAGVAPAEVDIVFSTTVTGLAVPPWMRDWRHAWACVPTSKESRCSGWAVSQV